MRNILLQGSLHVKSLLFCFFKFLSVFQKFACILSWHGSLWVHLAWNLLSFGDIYMLVFHQIWDNFLIIISSSSLSVHFSVSSLSENFTMCMLVFFMVFHRPFRLFSFFFIFYLLFIMLNNFHHTNYKFANSFFYNLKSFFDHF